MSQAQPGVVEYFNQQVPDAVLRNLCRAIITAHELAYSHCKSNYSDEESHDVIGQLRRTEVERAVRTVMQRHPEVDVSSVLNKAKNHSHNLLRVGNVMLTVSAVESPGDCPREALFRQEYAESNQYQLFEAPTLPAVNSTLYAIVTHGRPMYVPADSAAYPTLRFDRPAFIRVGFPAKEAGGGWQAPLIDLLQRFPELGQSGSDESNGTAVPKVPLLPVVTPAHG